MSVPVLAHFDDSLPVTIQTDASGAGLGVVMMQDREDGLQSVAFLSRALSGAELRYHANELKCLTVVWALKQFTTVPQFSINVLVTK